MICKFEVTCDCENHISKYSRNIKYQDVLNFIHILLYHIYTFHMYYIYIYVYM